MVSSICRFALKLILVLSLLTELISSVNLSVATTTTTTTTITTTTATASDSGDSPTSRLETKTSSTFQNVKHQAGVASINNNNNNNNNNNINHNNTQQSSSTHKNRPRKIIVSTVLEEPYMMLRQSGMFMTGNDRFHGYLADLIGKISSNAGFQHEIRLSRDGKYGELADGTWDGSMGEVLSEVADIAAGPLIMDELKHHYVDFTEPFLTLRSSALVKRQPISSKNHKNNSDSPHNHHHHHHQLYQAPMTGDELLKNMDYTIIILRDGPAQKSLSTSTDPLYRTAWARATSSWPTYGLVDSIQEGIERARREKFIFVVDSPTAEYVAGRKPCDLLATEPFLESVKYALVVRKGDRLLKQSIDKSLRQMRDNSELQSLYLKWWKDECKRFHHSSSSGAVKRSNSTNFESKTQSDSRNRHLLAPKQVTHQQQQQQPHQQTLSSTGKAGKVHFPTFLAVFFCSCMASIVR